MFSEYDIVRLRSAATASSVPISSLGTILIIYQDTPPAYEVEFIDDAGGSIGWFTMPDQEVEFVEKGRGL